MTAQTWRVVVGGGGTAEVEVARDGYYWVATFQADEGPVRGRACGWERAAVARLAGDLHWSVVEIRAPGEPTTAEAVAAAVAAETARCVAVCRAVTRALCGNYDGDRESDGAAKCADVLEGAELAPGAVPQ